MYRISIHNQILRDSDGASIPADPANSDYRGYLAWLSAGNTPIPAPIPDPKIVIRADIDSQERSAMLPRVVREFMLGYMTATYAPAQLALNPGYVKVKAFDDQIALLRAAAR